jgi:hypothetical protein
MMVLERILTGLICLEPMAMACYLSCPEEGTLDEDMSLQMEFEARPIAVAAAFAHFRQRLPADS